MNLRRIFDSKSSYYAILSIAQCGRRQVVRPKLPKLVFAGSSPVARSMNFPTLPSGGVFF